jgi:hypothetical protein
MFIQQNNTQDTDVVIDAITQDFPDTSGAAVEATDILILPDRTVKIYSHYQNGSIMVFSAPLASLGDGDMVASDPNAYLEDSANGKFVFSSRPLNRPLCLSEAKRVVELLQSMELI